MSSFSVATSFSKIFSTPRNNKMVRSADQNPSPSGIYLKETSSPIPLKSLGFVSPAYFMNFCQISQICNSLMTGKMFFKFMLLELLGNAFASYKFYPQRFYLSLPINFLDRQIEITHSLPGSIISKICSTPP